MNGNPFALWGGLLALCAIGISISVLIGRKRGRYVLRIRGGGKRLLEGENLQKWSVIALACMGVLCFAGILLFMGVLPAQIVIPLFLVCVFTLLLTALNMGQKI